MSECVFEGRRLTRRYPLDRGGVLTACAGINIQLFPGKTLGVVGESGSGKSTLLRLLSQLERLDEGELFFHGREITNLKGEDLRRYRGRIQMVFQDPSTAFFPRMKVWDAITEPLKIDRRLSRPRRRQQALELLKQVELPETLLDAYPHSMSGGQRQRLGIARALASRPEVLLCDEVTSALDEFTQDRLITLLADLQREHNLALLFVSHDLPLVQAVSHQIMVLYLGRVVECLPGEQLLNARHPYTVVLLESVFSRKHNPLDREPSVFGEAAGHAACTRGCSFHPYCPHCMEVCRAWEPQLAAVGPGHSVACHLFSE